MWDKRFSSVWFLRPGFYEALSRQAADAQPRGGSINSKGRNGNVASSIGTANAGKSISKSKIDEGGFKGIFLYTLYWLCLVSC